MITGGATKVCIMSLDLLGDKESGFSRIEEDLNGVLSYRMVRFPAFQLRGYLFVLALLDYVYGPLLLIDWMIVDGLGKGREEIDLAS